MRLPTFPASFLLGLAAATAAFLPASSSRATLIEQPPKLWTFRLDDQSSGARLDLLRSFLDAELERPGPFRRYISGRFGQWNEKPWLHLQWHPLRDDDSSTDEGDATTSHQESRPPFSSDLSGAFSLGVGPDSLRLTPEVPLAWAAGEITDPLPFFQTTGSTLRSNGYDSLWVTKTKPVVDWRCRRRPVRFVRGTGEQDVFPLVRCDGSVAPEALDRLTLMMRPPHVERPATGLLPDEPDAEAVARDEWIADVRLANPRLLWALQRIADAFPWRAIYVYSGYRPGAIVSGTTHHSLHSAARAVDIQVHGVPNVKLFEVCRTLEDVGCGFYPNSKFVHVDVRRPGTGHAVWIDASGPGEPARYVDAWPGVLNKGGYIWGPKRMSRQSPDGDPLSCVSGGVSSPSCNAPVAAP